MIPFVRQPLPSRLTARLVARRQVVAASATPPAAARSSWNGATELRRDLKARLCTMCARPSFCMYCYESRGTDVDHFEPISRDPLRTFEWNNHLLACGFCNQQAKKEFFPVDMSGHPLLLDPGVDDSALHMTLSSGGEFIELTPRGLETIAVLKLNDRPDLVDARFRSWRAVLRILSQAAERGSVLSPDDTEDLRFLPVVDTFHHFAHDVSVGRLPAKGVPPHLVIFANRNLPTLRDIFPRCRLP